MLDAASREKERKNENEKKKQMVMLYNERNADSGRNGKMPSYIEQISILALR